MGYRMAMASGVGGRRSAVGLFYFNTHTQLYSYSTKFTVHTHFKTTVRTPRVRIIQTQADFRNAHLYLLCRCFQVASALVAVRRLGRLRFYTSTSSCSWSLRRVHCAQFKRCPMSRMATLVCVRVTHRF